MSIDPAAGTMGLLGFAGSMLDPEEERERNMVGTGSPLADPLLTQASLQSLLMMGQAPDPALAFQGSPLAVAVSRYLNQAPNEYPVIQDLIKEVSEIMASLEAGEDPIDLLDQASQWRMGQLAGAIGMSPGQLIQSQVDYTARQEETFARASQIAEINQGAQYGVTENLANLMMDMPDVSASAIEDYKMQQRERLLRDLNRSVDEASEGALRQANFANYNPGRVLGDLEEARIRGTQDVDLASLEYALAMLGGQTNLATGSASQMQNYLGYPTQVAAQLAAIRTGGANAPTVSTPAQMIPSAFQQAFQLSTNAMANQQNANTASISAASDMMSGMAGGMMGG